MKKIITSMTVVASLNFAACGPIDELISDAGVDAGPTIYAFTTGTYSVSNAKASGTDQCGLLPAYTAPTKKIGIDVVGTDVTFNPSLETAVDPKSAPKATLVGNDITNAVEANYTVDYGGCVVRIKRTMVGTVTAANTSDLTFSFSVTKEAGTCAAGATAFEAIPCASAYQFTATKIQ